MTRYLFNRLVSIPVLLLGVSVILFLIVQIAPGGAETFFASEEHIPDPQQLEAIRRRLGLDDPIHVQYFRWLGGILRGDFGVSFISNHPVLEHIGERALATVRLTTSALVMALLIGVPIGVISAVYRYRLVDKIATFGAFVGISFPNFWLGMLLVLVFSVSLGWLPPSGIGRGDAMNRFTHIILPVLTLMGGNLATFTRYTRSSMMETLGQDYIRTARAKGLSDRVVIYRHALRNSMIPVVTILGIQLGSLVAGAAVVETVFAWPGMGRLAITAVVARDYPVIMGINVIVALVLMLGNLVVDLSYGFLDPRIRYS